MDFFYLRCSENWATKKCGASDATVVEKKGSRSCPKSSLHREFALPWTVIE
jgi:hypothetical protein